MKNSFLFFVTLVLVFVGTGCATAGQFKFEPVDVHQTFLIKMHENLSMSKVVAKPRSSSGEASINGVASGYQIMGYQDFTETQIFTNGRWMLRVDVHTYNTLSTYAVRTRYSQPPTMYTVPGGTVIDPRKGGSFSGGSAFDTRPQPSPWHK